MQFQIRVEERMDTDMGEPTGAGAFHVRDGQGVSLGAFFYGSAFKSREVAERNANLFANALMTVGALGHFGMPAEAMLAYAAKYEAKGEVQE
ncbi:hypothetical protein BEK67_19605 [Ralstonia pickettii]|nr:hypothetical protein BEK67_19605 [Ralstonia pickettii]